MAKSEYEIPERDVVDYLKKRVEQEGGDLRKCKWEGRVGAPDWFIMLDDQYWVETKRPKRGRVSGGQKNEHKVFAKHGIKVWLIKNFAEVDAFVRHILYMKGKK